MLKHSSGSTLRFSLSLCCLLLVLLNACGSPSGGASSNQPGATKHDDGTVVASTLTATSQPTAQVQTSCPAEGTGRAAVMPAMTLGYDQNIVYLSPPVLKRYDVQTKATTTILNNTNVATPQISADGQWVLFIALSNPTNSDNMAKIQLVRIDGQYLQTLYCAPMSEIYDPNGPFIQWSPNQKIIVFSQKQTSSSVLEDIYSLNIVSGDVQLQMSFTTPDQVAHPITWIDNTRVYVTSHLSANPSQANLFILDTSKGFNQRFNDLQEVYSADGMWGFDISADATKLVTCISSNSGSQIIARSVNGNMTRMIYNGNNPLFGAVRFIDKGSSHLMVAVYQSPSNQWGFWKINADGTGLMQLTNQPTGFEGFNRFSQYIWSNFSRDGSFYADGTSYGSLNGGSLTSYTSDKGALLVGWTTI